MRPSPLPAVLLYAVFTLSGAAGLGYQFVRDDAWRFLLPDIYSRSPKTTDQGVPAVQALIAAMQV